MAVFQGARLRTAALPADATAVRSRPAAPPSVQTAPRVRPTGLLLAAIMAATMIGLVYLTQTLGSNATSSEIRVLAAESEKLADKLRNQAFSVQTYSDPEEVIKRAQKLGLSRLDDDVVVLTVP